MEEVDKADDEQPEIVIEDYAPQPEAQAEAPVVSPSISQEPRLSPALQAQKDAHQEEEAHNEFYNQNFLELTTSNFMRASIWFNVILGLCALRGANGFTVFLAYSQVFCRAAQAAGIVTQNL